MSDICPLCFSRDNSVLKNNKDAVRYFINCKECNIIYTPKQFLPSKEIEKSRYELHNNSSEEIGYRNFLMRAINSAVKYLNKYMRGLDYGCGPGPVLSLLLGEMGYSCDNYDPFFSPEISSEKYNYIFSTEVLEHMFNPANEIKKISSLLVKGGILIIMTELCKGEAHFKNWYYVRDNTHVCFYSAVTIDYICKTFGFTMLESDEKRIFVLKKD